MKEFFMLFYLAIWSPFIGWVIGHFIINSLKTKNYYYFTITIIAALLYLTLTYPYFIDKIKNLLTFERRCTGHCCKAFILPWLTPSEMNERKKLYESGERKPDSEHNKEELYILNMIEYLGSDSNNFPEANQKVIPIDNFLHDKQYMNSDEIYKSHYYTCKHHCNVTGNCLDYENRPNLCRSFPNQNKWNGACEFRGCTKRYSLIEMIQYQYNKIKHFIVNFSFNWKYKYKRKIFKYIPEPIRVYKYDPRADDFDIRIASLSDIKESLNDSDSNLIEKSENTGLNS